MTRIAYNEHRPAPVLSATFKRRAAKSPESAAELAAEVRASRNAARNARRKLAARKGPAQGAPAPARNRAVLRGLRVQLKRAMRRGDSSAYQRIADALRVHMKVEL